MNTKCSSVRLFLACTLGSALVCYADESITNLVENQNIRIVKGKTYNLKTDRSFKTIRGKVEEAYERCALVRRFTFEAVSEEEAKEFRRSRTDAQRIGAYVSPQASPYENRRPIPADLVFVTNCPPKAVGSDVALKALSIGPTTVAGKRLEGFDCGAPALVPVLTSSEDTKAVGANLLARDQSSAAEGDADGLLRMGERYQIGNGVPRDPVKAREFYEKAAALGNADAKSALKSLR